MLKRYSIIAEVAVKCHDTHTSYWCILAQLCGGSCHVLEFRSSDKDVCIEMFSSPFTYMFGSIYQDIEATATRHAQQSHSISMEGSVKKVEEGEDEPCRFALDADGFVRVCLQLLRDNFLVRVSR